MSVIHKSSMQGHTATVTINASPTPSPHSIDYGQTAITTGRISTYELPSEDSIPEEESEETTDVSKIAMQYYTTVEPSSVGSSHDSTSTASPGSDSVASGHALHVAVLQSSGSDHPSVCIPASGSQSDSGSSTVKHWTYEEQFKQLYNMSPETERKIFLDKLFDFMQRKGTPITRIPIMAKQPLDLYRLFKLVVERGGLVEVIKKKAWRNVAKELNLPASITSAAFTMRSQYVKYLYPYECEVEKLSEPSELQLAIDSNKRDRRHSETVEFISPQMATCRPGELEQDISASVARVTTPQGLQLIGSPTVALPHGSVPPYSGGFIVTPGAHVMGPPVASRGQPQLLHMAPHGIPIVMPAPMATKEPSDSGSTEEGDEGHESADTSEPPTKRIALDPTQAKVANSPLLASVPPHTASFFVTPPGGGPIVQVPHSLTSHGAQLIQMSPQPFIVPTTAGSCSPTERWSDVGSERVRLIQPAPITRENTCEENGVSIAAVPSHTVSGMVIASGPQGTHVQSPRLVQLPTAHRPNVPVMMSTLPVQPSPAHPSGDRLERKRFEQLLTAGDRGLGEEEKKPSTEEKPLSVNSKVSFANISIQSAGSKDSDKSSDSSLLVTLELNSTVYQGVLFAKPTSVTQTSSPSR